MANKEKSKIDTGSVRPVVSIPQSVLTGISGIEQAIAQQTKWFKAWHEQVICNHDTREFQVSEIADLPLGAWYVSDLSQPFHNNPCFLTLGEKLNDLLAQVRVFLTEDNGPHAVDDYMVFMNTLMDMNMYVQSLQNDAWRGLTKMDPLTGVRNRHDMMADLDNERERARRATLPCAIAMVDLDHFKVINDVHGHLGGDQVLRKVSQMFADKLRPYDMVYRYGGEEFLLCLPNTDLNTAVIVLDRLRERIASNGMALVKGEADVFVTASFGVADVDTVEHIVKTIERADAALYDVKKSTRNAVKAWTLDGV